jgi:uncharacterized membrane protein YfcA
MKTALFAGLMIVALPFGWALGREVRRARLARSSGEDSARPSALELAIGLVTNFFDTLGIGSFAPTTAAFKLTGLVGDERIPGTLNVGHATPTMIVALIFIAIVEVDGWTLLLMIAAAVLGSWFGARSVSSWARRDIQVGMGVALLLAAALFVLTILDMAPGGGVAVGLRGWRLATAVVGNFALGALMEVGVGLYGPCLIMVALLGMNPQAAFPIMMGSCAFLMPIGSLAFVRSGRYSLRASLGLTLGGVPAVLVAAFVVKAMPLRYLRWLVLVVVLYAAVSMLRSALVEARGTLGR